VSADGFRRESRPIEGIGDWLDWRKGHVTASRVGALFDAHPYLTREQLAGELRGHSTKGDTPSLRRGRVLEAAVIEALREEHPDWRIERARDYHFLPQHRLGATPDAYLDEDGLIECKTVRPEVWEKWHGRPSLAYVLQLLTGLMCTGRTRGILAVMVLSSDYPVYEFEVPRHAAAEQRILEATAEWWRQWDAGEIAPPADAAELEAMLDDGSHKDMSDDPEILNVLDERDELTSRLSQLKQQLGSIEYKIKNRIGQASTAYARGWQLTFRRYHRKEYTVPAADVRVLRIKRIAEDSLNE
jgi:predicted phage-related endonuclease